MRFGIISFLLLVFSSNYIYAQGAGRDLFPLGTEESFMANTGLALRGSPGAAHFNPALLTTLSRPKFSISSSNFSFFKTSISDRDELDGRKLSLDISSFEPIPATMIQTFNYFGDAQAIFILVPSSLSADQKSSLDTDNLDITLLNVTKFQEFRIGGSYAHRLNSLLEGLSVGASLYGLYLHQTSTLALTTLADPALNTASFSANRDETKFYGMAGSIGLAYTPSEEWTFGLKWESPVLEIHGSSDSFSQTITVESGVLTEEEEIGPKNFNYDRPMAIGFGTAYSPIARFKVEADFYLLTPLSYKISSAGDRFRSGLGYEVRSGIQGRPLDWLRASAGFQYNPSAAKDNSSEDPVDYWGLSAGLDYLGDNYSFGLGGYYLSGSGESDALSGGAQGSKITAKHYGVLLTGSREF